MTEYPKQEKIELIVLLYFNQCLFWMCLWEAIQFVFVSSNRLTMNFHIDIFDSECRYLKINDWLLELRQLTFPLQRGTNPMGEVNMYCWIMFYIVKLSDSLSTYAINLY